MDDLAQSKIEVIVTVALTEQDSILDVFAVGDSNQIRIIIIVRILFII